MSRPAKFVVQEAASRSSVSELGLAFDVGAFAQQTRLTRLTRAAHDDEVWLVDCPARM